MLSLPDYCVVPNKIERYNLNNISELNYETDGSLNIYIRRNCRKESPRQTGCHHR